VDTNNDNLSIRVANFTTIMQVNVKASDAYAMIMLGVLQAIMFLVQHRNSEVGANTVEEFENASLYLNLWVHLNFSIPNNRF
jgi:hypothetical protein